MKKQLISILAILLVSVLILSSCELLGGNQNAYINFLQDALEAAQDKLAEAEEENDKLEDENKKLEKEISSLKNKLSTLQAEISSLKALDTENKGKIAALEADYAAKVAELEANKQANEEALAALEAAHKAKVEGLEGDIAELEEAYAAKVLELEANKQANEEALAKLEAEHKAEVDDLNENIADLEAAYAAKVAELEANNQANEEALANLKAEHKAAIEALNTENTNLALQIEALEARIEELLNDKDYMVTFDVNGGEGAVENQTIRYNMTVKEPTSPTKAYYDFLGWYVGGVKAEFPYVITANTEFVAEYAPTVYTITYNVNGGTMPATYISEYDVETGVTLPTPTLSFFLFDGWYEDAKFEGAKVTSISAGEVGNKTYYAKWVSTTNGIKYQLSNDGAYYTVTGYEGKDTGVVIPSSIDGIPVTAIANNAFKGKQKITSITVPDSVTSIGSYAFSECISLAELNLGNGVKTIPERMAYGCNKLESIVIPDSVTSISYYAFYNCDSLASVVIGDSVTSIGNSAFYSCDSLASVVIGDSVTSIGSWAFDGCSSLVSVVIGDSVTSIGGSAFSSCSSLVSVNIPDSVTSIGSQAFSSCSSLVSVTIPDSVTSIGSSSFYDCSSLYVVYNNSDLLLEIGSSNNGYVAYYAKVLVDHGEVSYANDGYNYTLTDDGFLFREKDSKYELIYYVGGEKTVTLPENINGNSYDLYRIRGVVNVIIPEGFITINDNAFYNCKSLVSVVIPDRATLPSLHPQNNYCTL